ncbi:MAG: aminotransferase class IV, partial [Desulfobulbaceae bacterium]|nr:aminotransferase class IV [Desulfobulbaceae bacterium]
VPIRTLTLSGDRGTMGIGSGIVHDSDADNEWIECLLKGKFLSAPRPEFQLIETMLWYPGSGYFLRDFHVERLVDSAAFFLFSINREEIEWQLAELEKQLADGNKPCRVRCLFHQDSRLEMSSSVLESLDPPSPHPRDTAEPFPVIISSRRTDNGDPFLYHKTTNRSLYDGERAAALEQGFYEVFFLNTTGEVTEGAISNIFIKQGGNMWTPPVSCGLLAGTLRRYLLEQGLAREKILRLQDLQHADAVYMGNSLRGLVRVSLSRESCDPS